MWTIILWVLGISNEMFRKKRYKMNGKLRYQLHNVHWISVITSVSYKHKYILMTTRVIVTNNSFLYSFNVIFNNFSNIPKYDSKVIYYQIWCNNCYAKQFLKYKVASYCYHYWNFSSSPATISSTLVATWNINLMLRRRGGTW